MALTRQEANVRPVERVLQASPEQVGQALEFMNELLASFAVAMRQDPISPWTQQRDRSWTRTRTEDGVTYTTRLTMAGASKATTQARMTLTPVPADVVRSAVLGASMSLDMDALATLSRMLAEKEARQPAVGVSAPGE